MSTLLVLGNCWIGRIHPLRNPLSPPYAPRVGQLLSGVAESLLVAPWQKKGHCSIDNLSNGALSSSSIGLFFISEATFEIATLVTRLNGISVGLCTVFASYYTLATWSSAINTPHDKLWLRTVCVIVNCLYPKGKFSQPQVDLTCKPSVGLTILGAWKLRRIGRHLGKLTERRSPFGTISCWRSYLPPAFL